VVRAVTLVALATLLGVLDGPVAQPPRDGAGQAPPATAAARQRPATPPAALSAPPGAVAALRAHDCDAALAALAGGVAAPGPLLLLRGLYAHACERIGVAEECLAAAPAGGPLDDWRLWVLADSAEARGHLAVAAQALARLLADHPASPLRRRALPRAAALAWRQGDGAGAVAWIEAGRREGLDGAAAGELEELAWTVANATGDRTVAAEAARRLLVAEPLAASRLGVVEVFRPGDGTLDWSAVLSPEDLVRRAASLRAAGLAANAFATLEQVPPARRPLGWQLLAARLLVDLDRGAEAIAVLATTHPQTPAEQAAVEWGLAQAKTAAAAVHRGSPARPAAERAGLARDARRHLERVVALGADPALAARALGQLFADDADGQRFDEALADLARLRQIAPDDRTGAGPLWRWGWREYRQRNYTGAIGWWGELASLYPASREARQGRYWSGRAFLALGERQRAEEIFREVAAADTGDFYRRHALARLAAPPPAAAPGAGSEPWPEDPRLGRAERLFALGLDDLALAETAALADVAAPRAAAALRAQILAAQGERRASIHELARAFPALGTPHQSALPEAALRLYYPLDFRDAVARTAALAGVPRPLVFAMVRQESAFDAGATSHAGARGLLQLMPATGRELAHRLGLGFAPDRLADPEFNLRLGTAYFRQVLGLFGGEEELALAGYNAGPYRVRRLWRQHPNREVDLFLEDFPLDEPRLYVQRIVLLADSYRQLYPDL
jgi:peptidoglycan lytic transglycosylase